MSQLIKIESLRYCTIYRFYTQQNTDKPFSICIHSPCVEAKDVRSPVCKRTDWFFSNLVHRFFDICISERFPFARIIHSAGRWDLSRCWSKSRITAQVCLGLVTIKGHSKKKSWASLRRLLTIFTEILCLIRCLDGWSQTMSQVKTPDVAVQGWRGYVWSAVVRPCWIYRQIH